MLLKNQNHCYFHIWLFSVQIPKQALNRTLDDLDVDQSNTETVSKMFQQDDEELSGIVGTSSWDSDHEWRLSPAFLKMSHYLND